jgi:hypothetical protein
VGSTSVHTSSVTSARPRTIGTNQPLTTSARRAIGAREPWACSTASTIRASAVSPPVRVMRTVSAPLWFWVPP